jgi:hypothetical protein
MKHWRILFLFAFLGIVASTLNPPSPIYAADPAPGDLPVNDWETIQSLLPNDYFKASNTGTLDHFGAAIAVDGDTVVVGVHFEDSAATGVNGNQADNSAFNAGAVYIFTRTGGVWSQQAYLKASNTGASDNFGYAVAIDGNTVVVGAYGEDSATTGVNGNQADNSATNAGAAYIFTRTGGVWSQQAYLKASNTGANDNLGFAVAVDGDTAVVGAYGEDSAATGVNGNQADNSAGNAGAVYVFTRVGSVWSQQAYLKASNTGANDRFGAAVALDNNTTIVGAYGEDSAATGVNGNQADNSASEAGAAYVFTRVGSAWSQQAYLKASNTGANDGFGLAVALDEATAVVGAYGEDSAATGVNGNQSSNAASDSGAAYIFTRTGSVWSQQAYVKASNTQASDYFGYDVAIEGDTAVVGAYQEDSAVTGINGNQADNSATDAGAAYVLVRTGGVWSQQAYLKASNTGAYDIFGDVVAVDGDTVVVGASLEDGAATGVNGNQADNSASEAGAVYVFARCRRSAQSGAWENGATWVGGTVPASSTDGVCIGNGHTVMMNTNHAIDQLWVYPGGILDLATYTLTVEKGVSNDGTLRQNRPVNNASVSFLHILNAAQTITHYRGVVLDASLNGGNNLANTTVSVRELNGGEYCTQTEGSSPAYVRRCFEITPDTQTGTAVLLRLYGRTADELNGIPPAALAVYHNTPAGSGTWVEQTTGASTGSDGGAYRYAQAEVASFSPFLLGETGESPTAVTLLHFQSVNRQTTPVLAFGAALLLTTLGGVGLWKHRKTSVLSHSSKGAVK